MAIILSFTSNEHKRDMVFTVYDSEDNEKLIKELARTIEGSGKYTSVSLKKDRSTPLPFKED